jgi:uncharacterized protein (TIGR04141 family)
MKQKTQKLTVLLLKETLDSFEEAIRDDRNVLWLELRDDIGLDGRFAYIASCPHSPKWLEYVGPALEGDLEAALNSSSYGVLFVGASGRRFALTFGYGWSLLKPDSYELGFGLRTALNRVDPAKLRSLDLLAYEDLVITTRRQTSRGSEIGSFSPDVATDVLRAVVGSPRGDLDWAKSIGGNDALTIRAPILIEELGNALEILLAAYEDDTYKENFGWIDHLSTVDDKEVKQELDELLVECLRSDTWEQAYLAPPEPIDWERVEGFGYSGTRDKSRYDDLLLEDYFSSLGEDARLDVRLEILRRHKAGICWTGSDALDKRWSIYSCLVWETEHQDMLYALLAGTWFQVEIAFVEQVREYLASIDTTPLDLPSALSGEWEQAYNKRAAASREDLCLLDRKLFTLPGANSTIEFCDLLSLDKQIIHVKRRTHSATLSHLFSQGAVSAEAFLVEDSLREDIRAHLDTINRGTFTGVVPIDRPIPGEYEITFVIIEKSVPEWPEALPFFSKLNLMQRAKHLRTLGFRVRLVHVEELET